MKQKRNIKRRLFSLVIRYLGDDFYQAVKENLNGISTHSFVNSGISIGEERFIPHPYYLHNSQYIKIGNRFFAGPGLRLEAWDSYKEWKYQPSIVIGDGVACSQDVHIGAIASITIGDNVLIGSHVLITDHSHGDPSQSEMDVAFLERPLTTKGPVVIHNNVWIGEGACILSGVTIGSGAIVGANSVVTRDVKPGQIVGGVPARPIGHSSTP